MSYANTSLLQRRGEPVLGSAIEWITSTMLGSIALGLCTIAVAVVGLMMLEGRVPIRQGARVIVGCFVIFGAPVIAAGLMGAWQSETVAQPPPITVEPDPASAREEPPPANYDPYAGASLRRD